MRLSICVGVLGVLSACSSSDDAATLRETSPNDATADSSSADGSDSGDDASGGSAGSSGDASDASADVDAGEPDPLCEGLDETSCDDTPGCVSRKGEDSTGKHGFAGCAHWCVGSASPTCGIAPDGSCWFFVDQCVPDGWKLIEFCGSIAKCTTLSDAGG